MEEHIGATQLIEYIEQAADGSYCKLMGWPSQIGLSTQSSKYNGVNLESWHPNTAPTFPSALQWMPYKIAKTVPHVLQSPGQGHPLHGALRYHKDFGWYYRYSTPFGVTGRPPLPSSMISNAPDSSVAIPKGKRRSKKPQLKTNRKAFIKLKKIALSIGLPELQLRRVDQQPGFRSLNVLLEV